MAVIKSVALVVLLMVLVAILFGSVRVALRILHLKRFMSGEHFAEAAALFSRIEDRAVRMIDEPTPGERGSADPFSDPRFAISKHGLVIQYTCVSSDDVAHHVSTSDRGGRLTYSAAGRLGYLFLHQLGIELSRVAVSRSEAGIFHLDFELRESEHEALAARPDLYRTAKTLEGVELAE